MIMIECEEGFYLRDEVISLLTKLAKYELPKRSAKSFINNLAKISGQYDATNALGDVTDGELRNMISLSDRFWMQTDKKIKSMQPWITDEQIAKARKRIRGF